MDGAWSSGAITRLLKEWRDGKRAALDELMPAVYEELHRLAHRYMRSEEPGHTLQTTALVNEAYVRLAGSDVDWKDRAHFFAVAANLMRRILVDHAKAQQRVKRGGGRERFPLDSVSLVAPEPCAGILEMDEALQRLAAVDRRKCEVLELHYFGGLNYDETAEVLKISTATVDRELRFAKAWLRSELHY
jgi:RNA polymerase sigma factor (TIGR02999 family)